MTGPWVANRRHVFLAGRCPSKPSFRPISFFPTFFLNFRSHFFLNVFPPVTGWCVSTLEGLFFVDRSAFLFQSSTSSPIQTSISPQQTFLRHRAENQISPHGHKNNCVDSINPLKGCAKTLSTLTFVHLIVALVVAVGSLSIRFHIVKALPLFAWFVRVAHERHIPGRNASACVGAVGSEVH